MFTNILTHILYNKKLNFKFSNYLLVYYQKNNDHHYNSNYRIINININDNINTGSSIYLLHALQK